MLLLRSLLSTSLTVLVCLSTSVFGLQNVTVEDSDSRISYQPQRLWSTELTRNRTSAVTSSDLASAILTFRGSAVYFMSYPSPVSNPSSNEFQVIVDGVVNAVSTRPSSTNLDSEESRVVFSQTNLDPEAQHQIVIANPDGISVNVDAFIITVPDGTTDIGSQTTFDMTDEERSRNASKGAITAGVLGGVFVLGVVILILFAIFKRRQKRHIRDLEAQFALAKEAREQRLQLGLKRQSTRSTSALSYDDARSSFSSITSALKVPSVYVNPEDVPPLPYDEGERGEAWAEAQEGDVKKKVNPEPPRIAVPIPRSTISLPAAAVGAPPPFVIPDEVPAPPPPVYQNWI